MGSGISRVKAGSIYGTGAALSVRNVGFRPRKVEILNVGGLAQLQWTDHMADAAGLKQVTDGTLSLLTSNGITPLSDGFTLGADTDLNVDGELIHWVAYE